MTGGGSSEQLWTNFYDTLSQIRMYHAKFPNAARISAATAAATGTTAAASKDAASSVEGEVADQDSDSILLSGGRSVHFSAEESFGARVDMHELYERYINLPQFARTGAAGSASAPVDYLTFLRDFPALGRTVPREKKLKAQPLEYRRFLTDLRDYLIGFHERTKPLADTNVLREMIRQEFEAKWERKEVEGWFGEVTPAAAAVSAAAAAEQEPGAAPAAAAAADSSSSAAAPAAASSEFFCAACSKQFAGAGVFNAHLSGKKHKKNAEIAAALSSTSSSAAAPAEDANASAEGVPSAPAAPASLLKVSADLRSLALLEMEISSFADLLAPELTATREHLLKKQTRTYEELQAEIAATQAEVLRAKMALKSGGGNDEGAEEGEDDAEADANAPLYNPLNLPLGFDGKPIPYWLYKLHGLNLKFDCEICGNFSYAGPRNFERHFTEWRHAYGMRALGIPNTKHFAHITKMADAQALFEKLKREGVGAGFKPEEEEEMEDAEGNVFNKRTYLELQKQGLV